MKTPPIKDRLAKAAAWRSIAKLANSHIELTWDMYTITMRQTDLSVLSQVLEAWYVGDLGRAESYTLWLGETPIAIDESDLYLLRDMTQTAIRQMGARKVYWIDIPIQLTPHESGIQNGPTIYSLN